MRTHVLETTESRHASDDALVESSNDTPPVGAEAGADPEAVEYLCGGCRRTLWEAHPSTTRDAGGRDAEPERARRVLIECPDCGALNVVPPHHGEPS